MAENGCGGRGGEGRNLGSKSTFSFNGVGAMSPVPHNLCWHVHPNGVRLSKKLKNMLRKKREQHASKTGVDKKGVKRRGDKGGGDGKVEVKPPCSDKVAHTFMVMGALFFLCTSHSPPTLNTRVVQPGTAHDGMFRSKELLPPLSSFERRQIN